MAIKSVRVYFYPLHKRREAWLTANYWGWAEWFEGRLKPYREQLREPEAQGVNIVNLLLLENPRHATSPDTWVRALNTFQFEFVCDLQPFARGDKMENLEKLMGFYAAVARSAPWPQMQFVADALAGPLTPQDRESLRPFLQWPRAVGRLARCLA